MGPINNIPTLVQIMAWRRPGDKPLSETIMVRLLTHICVTRPQWVNRSMWCIYYHLPVTLCIYHDVLTHWPLRSVVVIIKVSFFHQGYVSEALSVKFISCKCQNITLMIIQHWKMWWLAVVSHQAINWGKDDHAVWRYMAPLSHKELTDSHDDVIEWKPFPRYWPFVRGIHQSVVNSSQRPALPSFDVYFDLSLDKRLSKQSWGWWFETPPRLLWRQYNDVMIYHCYLGSLCLYSDSMIDVLPAFVVFCCWYHDT